MGNCIAENYHTGVATISCRDSAWMCSDKSVRRSREFCANFAQQQGVNPCDYLKDLFMRLSAAKITQIKEFKPTAWAKAKGIMVAQTA